MEDISKYKIGSKWKFTSSNKDWDGSINTVVDVKLTNDKQNAVITMICNRFPDQKYGWYPETMIMFRAIPVEPKSTIPWL